MKSGIREQGPALGQDNLFLIGTVPRHRLDSLNTGNELLKNKNKMKDYEDSLPNDAITPPISSLCLFFILSPSLL